MSKIEWTEVTWNPTTGCSEVSPGCTNCYAAKMAWRLQHIPGQPMKDYAGTVKKLPNGRIVWTGKVNMLEHRLLEPAQNKKPTTYFVDSMSDLFHEDIPVEFIDKVFAVMAMCPQHIFQILTKRTDRMLEYIETGFGHRSEHIIDWLWGENSLPQKFGVRYEFISQFTWPIGKIWLGTSVENQKVADQRREPLRALSNLGWLTWVSNEPCIGPIDWTGWEFISWLVTGGESGSNARPMHPGWARAARDYCDENRIAFFFKQWGQWGEWHKASGLPNVNKLESMELNIDGSILNDDQELDSSEDVRLYKIGKHNSGRLLDGKTHDAYPEIRNSQTANSTI